jgi:hypothetical protein
MLIIQVLYESFYIVDCIDNVLDIVKEFFFQTT